MTFADCSFFRVNYCRCFITRYFYANCEITTFLGKIYIHSYCINNLSWYAVNQLRLVINYLIHMIEMRNEYFIPDIELYGDLQTLPTMINSLLLVFQLG